LAAALQLSVEDNGPGLSGVAAEDLFEQFARGRLGGSRAGGVGLGLAICRVIARLHEGDIVARTAASGGARFELTLPLAAEAERMDTEAMTGSV
jgi:signal transduction histidine kinase